MVSELFAQLELTIAHTIHGDLEVRGDLGLWCLGDQKAQQFLICDGQLIQDVEQTIERIHVRDDLFHAGCLVDEIHAVIRIAVLAAVRLVNGGLSGATGSIAFFPLEVCLITQAQFVAFLITGQAHWMLRSRK